MSAKWRNLTAAGAVAVVIMAALIFTRHSSPGIHTAGSTEPLPPGEAPAQASNAPWPLTWNVPAAAISNQPTPFVPDANTMATETGGSIYGGYYVG